MRPFLKITAIAYGFFLCSLIFLDASGNVKSGFAQTSDERLKGEADSALVVMINGRQVRRLVGNVRFRQGDAFMSCDSAVQYTDVGVANLHGNVYITTGIRELFAEKVTYNERTRVEEASGNVMLFDSTRILSSELLTYYENEEKAIARGAVSLEDTANYTILRCGYLEYQRQGGYAAAWSNPVLVKMDSTGADTLHIYGEKMEVFDSGERAIVTGDVRIRRKTLDARCGAAEYLEDSDRIILTAEPSATRKFDTIFGERFELLLHEAAIETILVTGDALITSPMDTLQPGRRINKLSGQKVTMILEDEELNKILIEERAASSYYLVEEGDFRGVNNITGDFITIFIADNELVRVRIHSTPGKTNGTYYPPRLEGSAEKEAAEKKIGTRTTKKTTIR